MAAERCNRIAGVAIKGEHLFTFEQVLSFFKMMHS